jgi:uncharacterized RDD family membrane protein YckC
MPSKPGSATTPATDSTQLPAAPPAELPIAGPIARLAALGYDSFLIFGLLVVPLFILTGLRAPHTDLQTDGVVHELPLIASREVMLPYMICMVAGFYFYFWRRNGQTLGMQAWRLRLDSNSGGRASLRQCLIRMPVGFIALLCGGLGYWWIWIDRDRRAWHDRASDTRVVVLPKRKKAAAQPLSSKSKPAPAGPAVKKAGKASAAAPKARRR